MLAATATLNVYRTLKSVCDERSQTAFDTEYYRAACV